MNPVNLAIYERIDSLVDLKTIDKDSRLKKIGKVALAAFVGIYAGFSIVRNDVSSKLNGKAKDKYSLKVVAAVRGVVAGFFVGSIKGAMSGFRLGRIAIQKPNPLHDIYREHLNSLFADKLLLYKFYAGELEEILDTFYQNTSNYFQLLNILGGDRAEQIEAILKKPPVQGVELREEFAAFVHDLEPKDAELLKDFFIYCAMIARHQSEKEEKESDHEVAYEKNAFRNQAIQEMLGKIVSPLYKASQNKSENTIVYQNLELFVAVMIKFCMDKVLPDVDAEYQRFQNQRPDLVITTNKEKKFMSGFVGIGMHEGIKQFKYAKRKLENPRNG